MSRLANCCPTEESVCPLIKAILISSALIFSTKEGQFYLISEPGAPHSCNPGQAGGIQTHNGATGGHKERLLAASYEMRFCREYTLIGKMDVHLFPHFTPPTPAFLYRPGWILEQGIKSYCQMKQWKWCLSGLSPSSAKIQTDYE